MNPFFSGFQKMDIEHYSTQPTISQLWEYSKCHVYIETKVICLKTDTLVKF